MLDRTAPRNTLNNKQKFDLCTALKALPPDFKFASVDAACKQLTTQLGFTVTKKNIALARTFLGMPALPIKQTRPTNGKSEGARSYAVSKARDELLYALVARVEYIGKELGLPLAEEVDRALQNYIAAQKRG